MGGVLVFDGGALVGDNGGEREGGRMGGSGGGVQGGEGVLDYVAEGGEGGGC